MSPFSPFQLYIIPYKFRYCGGYPWPVVRPPNSCCLLPLIRWTEGKNSMRKLMGQDKEIGSKLQLYAKLTQLVEE